MGLWDSKEPINGEILEPASKSNPIEAMVLKMVAGNPAIQKAFEGLQGLIQSYVDRQKSMDEKLDLILQQNAQIRAAFLNTLPGLPSGEARGVISDGVRCVQCGSDGDCHDDCPIGGTAARAATPASGDGSSGGGSGGGVGAHDSGNG